jgi:hypothetical protein
MYKTYKILAVLLILFLESYIGIPLLKSGDQFLIIAGTIYTLCLMVLLWLIFSKFKKYEDIQ